MGTVNDPYYYLPPNFFDQLDQRLVHAVKRSRKNKISLFFRADDIGVPGEKFTQLLNLHIRFDVPLALAVVPAWISLTRWKTIVKEAQRKKTLWCWHQHGWRHTNHESEGKKQEFGPARSKAAIIADLDKGRYKLKSILGNDFFPVFTPPWNRCDQRTLIHLNQKKYLAVSRFKGNIPQSLSGLPDFYVNVDLHTRKEADSHQMWDNLLNDFTHAFESGYCGVMLHHQRMSFAAFSFLGYLLKFVVNSPHIQVTNFNQLVI